jgi:hypothetical protein
MAMTCLLGKKYLRLRLRPVDITKHVLIKNKQFSHATVNDSFIQVNQIQKKFDLGDEGHFSS